VGTAVAVCVLVLADRDSSMCICPLPLLKTPLQISNLFFQSPSLVLLGEGPAHASHLSRAVRGGHASGNLVHDAHIAALAIEHGVHEFWTIDRDFTRFPGLRIHNPFVE
jgi:predicted nucleic acid-binding protein